MILLETRVSQIGKLIRHARQSGKKIIVHTDLIQGLKTDEYAMEFLINDLRVDGIISTRSSMITMAKKQNILAIQRLFVLDSQALAQNMKMIRQTAPDYIELLPGILPAEVISEIRQSTGIPVIAGGLIRTPRDIQNAFAGGAVAVTTSKHELWDKHPR